MEANRSPQRRRRDKLLLGNLPDDFLRFDSIHDNVQDPSEDNSSASQIAHDEQAAMALQQQYFNGMNCQIHNLRGRLDVTVIEAKLVKNYGVTRMDPYFRLRVGHHIYETKTCYNGARNPKWNKVFHCFIPKGVDSINIEIFDECAFLNDERIAWAIYPIPKSVFDGETLEEVVQLNGKQGEGKEGVVVLVLSFTSLPTTSAMFQIPMQSGGTAMVMQQNADGQRVKIGQPVPSQHVKINEEDHQQIQEMFPNIDLQVIKTVIENQRGNKDRTINVLLQMNAES